MKVTLLRSSLAIALFGLVGCTDNSAIQGDAPFYVATTTVAKAIETQNRIFRGVVVPAEQTPVGFRLGGEIEKLYVQAGDVIKKGQLLAKLEDSKEKQNLDDAQAKYTLATRQLNRGKELFGRQMLSKAEYDELVANQKLVGANLNHAKNQFNYTSLYAPFSGKVSEVFKEAFEPTGEGEAVVSLYQHDKLYVKIDLSDNLLALINPTQGARMRQYQPQVSFSGIDDSYSMNFLEYATEPDENTRTYQLFLSAQQPRTEILPGTSASVAVDMGKAGISSMHGYSVPLTALQAGVQHDREFFVWKLLGDKVTKVPVTVSQLDTNGAIVSSGISEGDTLINSSLRKLREGAAVNILEKK